MRMTCGVPLRRVGRLDVHEAHALRRSCVMHYAACPQDVYHMHAMHDAFWLHASQTSTQSHVKHADSIMFPEAKYTSS
jgi:hypothetical protein